MIVFRKAELPSKCNRTAQRYLPNFDDQTTVLYVESARADAEATRADTAEFQRATETARANSETVRADTAEARVRELEAQLRQQNPAPPDTP